ncbi:MAG TPA: 6-phosphogluconolactonase, partial [Candidatus Krumholzibacteria bacterium]|nr:6-phosphogluconolactonase [Candidatus Krumholzibacteria bacterium]
MKVCKDREALAVHAADMIVNTTAAAIRSRGKAMIALCGGRTPQPAYALVAQSPRVNAIDWTRTFVFLTDERFVPSHHPENNFGMLQRTLLAPAGVDASHAFAVPTELATAQAAATAYEATLAAAFAQSREYPPRFDLIVLGLGEDGHIASLFPGAAALDVRDRWVVASPPGSLAPLVERVTLTLPVLNAARAILLLAAGANKAAALRGALDERPGGNPPPAARVHPADGKVTWLVDAAASGA